VNCVSLLVASEYSALFTKVIASANQASFTFAPRFITRTASLSQKLLPPESGARFRSER
jgi:hypothetical protein